MVLKHQKHIINLTYKRKFPALMTINASLQTVMEENVITLTMS